jgi:two-component system osmolarity sensor histidine kinase EnvZ
MGDEVELVGVLSNLLENARRYGKSPDGQGTRVRIAATAHDFMVTLRVRDHGPGVAPELLPNLTRPFFRGDSARTSATGAGLGLAIVVKMVQSMGGSLQLINSPSGGLLALIRLHQADDQRGPGHAPPKKGRRPG